MKFKDLKINEDLLSAIPFREMTPILKESIPIALEGYDLIAEAKTGSGKTFCFLISILNKLFIPDNSPQAIILTPTRELAIQISKEAKKLSSNMKKVKIATCYGGEAIGKQSRVLNKGAHLIIGTPGRVLDLISRGYLDLNGIETVVLDEADLMLDMGFKEDILKILDNIKFDHQTLLFSATISNEIPLNNPKIIKLKSKTKIKEFYIEVDYENKIATLIKLIEEFKLVLVFCNTKKLVKLVNRDLKKLGYVVDCLHGDLTQKERDKVMNKFSNGNLEVLVASNLASRGLDIRFVEAVINYDLPFTKEDYIHRIGRTSRAGNIGFAFSFVEKDEIKTLNEIKKVSKIKNYLNI